MWPKRGRFAKLNQVPIINTFYAVRINDRTAKQGRQRRFDLGRFVRGSNRRTYRVIGQRFHPPFPRDTRGTTILLARYASTEPMEFCLVVENLNTPLVENLTHQF